jgi:hypothetical protein
MQSDPEEEYEEMLLKAWAPMRAIDPTIRIPRRTPIGDETKNER